MLTRLALVILLSTGFAIAPALTDTSVQAATTKKKKKISHNRSDFTPEQREKLMAEARKICKKRYGAGAKVYRIDYKAWKIWCEE